jgi:hypothetical protein
MLSKLFLFHILNGSLVFHIMISIYYILRLVKEIMQ